MKFKIEIEGEWPGQVANMDTGDELARVVANWREEAKAYGLEIYFPVTIHMNDDEESEAKLGTTA